MSQKIFGQDDVQKPFVNVGENWKLYDTVLITKYLDQFDYNVGWFDNYANFAGVTNIPFFNVRNRNHGLAYNNQDTRDQLPYVFRIYSVGAVFFAPATSTYNDAAPILAPQTTSNHLFEIELPKHCSLTLKTNQDERLKIPVLYAPGGYGVVSGGLAQGDPEVAYTYPNITHASFSQGEPIFGNTWGFPKPLEIPRTANLSVVLEFNEYARQMLQSFVDSLIQPMRDVANDGSFYAAPGCAGVQITLQGQRLVQQRGQYHA